MPQGDQLPRPVMRARARLHADETGRQLFEKGKQVATPNAALQNSAPFRIDAVNLEDRLGEIETDGSDRHGWLLI